MDLLYPPKIASPPWAPVIELEWAGPAVYGHAAVLMVHSPQKDKFKLSQYVQDTAASWCPHVPSPFNQYAMF